VIGLWIAALLVGVISSLLAPPVTIDLATLLATILFAVGLTVFESLTIVHQSDRPLAVTLAVLIGAMIILPWPLFLLATAIGAVAGALARQAEWWQALVLASIRWIALTAGSVVLIIAVQQHTFEANVASPFAFFGLISCGLIIYVIERLASASLTAPNTGEGFLSALHWRWDDAGWYALIYAPFGWSIGNSLAAGCVGVCAGDGATDDGADQFASSASARRSSERYQQATASSE
jgi:hypothetical protein